MAQRIPRGPKLNQMSVDIVGDNILKENPVGHEDLNPAIAIVKEMPAMERIQFRNMCDPGVTLDFHYSSKNIPLTMYHLADGKEADLPCEVVDWLMDRKVPIYGHRKNSDGYPEIYVKGYKYNFQLNRVRRAA